MEYSIKEIARIMGADAKKLQDATVSILLTDSRRLSFPEQSLFFALQTKTNDGHNYIQELYKLRVRNFGRPAVGMADERQKYIRNFRSRHFPTGRNGTPATHHRTDHRRDHKYRGSTPGELYIFHAEMPGKADLVQRLRSDHL